MLFYMKVASIVLFIHIQSCVLINFFVFFMSDMKIVKKLEAIRYTERTLMKKEEYLENMYK